ncbi:MAG: repeat-containing protein [Acidimicrobiales bacterium]|nr:repeat-containing protein [Acidimicrobiales bacterium]
MPMRIFAAVAGAVTTAALTLVPVTPVTAAGVAGPFTSTTMLSTGNFAVGQGYDRTLTHDSFSAAAVGDVTGDGQPDIIAGFVDGVLRGWHSNGQQFLNFNTGPGAIEGSPVLADLTGDGILDIVVTNTNGDVIGLTGSGQVFFHQRDVGFFHRHGIFGSAAIADLDRDGRPEIIAGSFDTYLYAWHLDGTLVAGWPTWLKDTIWSSPTVVDLDHDGYPEVVIGGDCDGAEGQPCFNGVPYQNHGGYVWVFDHNGAVKPGWPQWVPGQTVWSTPVVADLFNDGRLEVVSGTGLNFAAPAGSAVYAWDSSGNTLPGWPVGVGGRVMATPAIGDLNDDGIQDVAVMADDGRIYAISATGQMLPGWPQCAASNRSACPVALHGSVSIADVLGNGHQQVVAGGEQWVRVWNGSGGGPAAELVTKSGTEPLSSAPTIANVGGSAWIVQTALFENGTIANQGNVWIWSIPGQAPGLSAWPTFKHDSRRTGVGFLGSVPKARNVTRLAGADRFGTAAAISQATYGPGVPVAYIATGLGFADALAGAPAAAKGAGPVLLVDGGGIPGPTAAELQRIKPGRIVVLGGEGAVSAAQLNALKGYTSGTVTRLAGASRYETAAAVSAAAFGIGVPVAYVATGAAFPDALSGGAAAAAKGGPMLLVPGDTIPTAVQAELARLHPQSIVVLGGASAVSDAVMAQLALTTTPPGNVRRVSGPDRYQTATAVAADAFPNAPSAFVATGLNFPDALAGGVLAGRSASPLLLVPGTIVPFAVRGQVNRLQPRGATVLGGPGALNDLVEFQAGY